MFFWGSNGINADRGDLSAANCVIVDDGERVEAIPNGLILPALCEICSIVTLMDSQISRSAIDLDVLFIIMRLQMRCNEIVLRHYQPADLEQIITLYQASVRQLAAGDYTPGQIAAWSTCDRQRWQQMMSSGQILLAMVGERIAGFSRTEPDGYLDLLFTHPDFPRRGVATRLADRLESDLRQQGIKQVTTHGSITAQPFYVGRGYQVLEQQQVEVRGETFVNYRMSKALSEED